MITLGLDIGSNSVGSAWVDTETQTVELGVSVFPAGVEESDEKRGEPKNAKRRMARRTRITLRRRSERKRLLRRKLIEVGLLPAKEVCQSCSRDEASVRNEMCCFKRLLETDPWELRRKGLDEKLSPFEFGRVLLHLSQRRGALGLRIVDPDQDDTGQTEKEEGKVKRAIGEVQAKMKAKKARTFGEFIAMVRVGRVTPITSMDKRAPNQRKGPREWRTAVRNKAASYEHCADRRMIRYEFNELWKKQKELGGKTGEILTDELRLELDDERDDDVWRHKGLLFGQRKQSWDLGTLGRCRLEPTERCVPHADRHASRYRVVETINNLKIREAGKPERPLTVEERERIKAYLSGPLGMLPETRRKDRKTGEITIIPERPKRTVSVTDLRAKMAGWYGKDKWPGGQNRKLSPCSFNIEADEDREINTDWFSREIVHGAIGTEAWAAMPERLREGFNRAILRFDPVEDAHAGKLKEGVMRWSGLDEARADALVAAWKGRPRIDSKRLSMSRRAVRNLLPVMDADPWPNERSPIGYRWPTQIEARKAIASDDDFKDVTTGEPFDDVKRRRYATGAKGATARDRYYMGKHVLMKDGKPVIDKATGKPLAEPPPAPLISNPVVRKAIHEVRRHLIEYMVTFERKPDKIYVELSREAKMGKKDADRLLDKNRLRNRIRNDIPRELNLDGLTSTQKRAAVDRVILAVQQNGVCPLCGNQAVPTTITLRMAAEGADCEIAHIIPRASGGHNGLGNIVLAHTKCNRDMGRRTPREFWEIGAGFEQGMCWIDGIYAEVARPKPAEVKGATGKPLWACYFQKRDDTRKIEQFKKEIRDIQDMTNRQDAATKYAARQVMRYLSDALYDGKGLPERGTGGEEDGRRIYATDGMWTSRLRREWGLFFDPHESRAKDIDDAEQHERKEKDRGDHRHHAIDAVVIAHSSRKVQFAWESREKDAPNSVRTAEEMEDYRRANRLAPPPPFGSRDDFRASVERAVYGNGEIDRPICHRAVKRKLIGALHKETLQGPVIDTWVRDGETIREPVKGRVTVRQSVLGEEQTDFLKPSHLRMPRPETDSEAIQRLTRRFRIGKPRLSQEEAVGAARRLVRSEAFTRANIDPKPGKGGIVRDQALRRVLRRCLERRGLDPDNYSKPELKRSIDEHGPLRMDSGVPIHRVVLLWSNAEPVSIRRDHYDYATGRRRKLDDPATIRHYDSQNNHHIEIRIDEKGKWSGEIVSAFDASRRKLARLRAFREAEVPKPKAMRELPVEERRRWRPVIREIESAHPIVDRSDDDAKGGRFVMSLCEGETLYMRHKKTAEVGYFVVAKLEKPQRIVLVPHWDARKATARKNPEGKKVPDSKRDQFAATPSDLKTLAPPGHEHAVKVRVSPLGNVTVLERD